MYVADAVQHYGCLREIARVLGISATAVRKWGEIVPAESAIRLSHASDGALKVDSTVYERMATERNEQMARAAAERHRS